MLKILGNQAKVSVYPAKKRLVPGVVGQLYKDENGMIFCGKSDGSDPCGIVGETDNTGGISVWNDIDHGLMIDGVHDVITAGYTGWLFVNNQGLLTKKVCGKYIVGKVINYVSPFLLDFEYWGPQKKINSGMACIRCKAFNEYAESNQADGSFKCYGCRR